MIASGVWTLTQLFPFLYSMTRGGPGYETSTLDYMVYLKSFGLGFGSDYGHGHRDRGDAARRWCWP